MAELPFILMHPKPEEEPKESESASTVTNNVGATNSASNGKNDAASEPNLIQLDA